MRQKKSLNLNPGCAGLFVIFEVHLSGRNCFGELIHVCGIDDLLYNIACCRIIICQNSGNIFVNTVHLVHQSDAFAAHSCQIKRVADSDYLRITNALLPFAIMLSLDFYCMVVARSTTRQRKDCQGKKQRFWDSKHCSLSPSFKKHIQQNNRPLMDI